MPADNPVNQYGPAGTYGCACVSDDARNCVLIRYGWRGHFGCDALERCECLCHTWREQDEDDDAD